MKGLIRPTSMVLISTRFAPVVTALGLLSAGCGPKGPAPAGSSATSSASAAKSVASATRPTVTPPLANPVPTAPADGVWVMSDLYRAVHADKAKYVGSVVQLKGFLQAPPSTKKGKRAPVGPLDEYTRVARTPTAREGGVVCVPKDPIEIAPGTEVIASGSLTEIEEGLRLDDCTLTAKGGDAPAGSGEPAPAESAPTPDQ